MNDKQSFEDALKILLTSTLKTLGFNNYQDLVSIEIPKDNKFGDFSTNIALRLSAFSKEDPLKIAQSIVNNLKTYIGKSSISKDIEDIKIVGGFINLFLSRDYFYRQLKDILKNKDAGKLNLGNKKRVLIEFVSANPTGPLSIAHARAAVVGDVLTNVLNTLGFQVKKEYYINDEGHQIELLGESIRARLAELSHKPGEFPKEGYRGEYIYDIARQLIKKAKVPSRKSEFFANIGIKYVLKTIKADLKDFGVKFDYWYSQKELRKSGKINKSLQFLKRKDLIYEKEGAFWFRSTSLGDDKDRVVIKNDGSYTYLAPDIAYHRDKYKRNFDWLINIWGPDHHGYINRLKAACLALGIPGDSLSTIIVQLATLYKEGRPLVMSKRLAQFITLREILDEVGRDAARFFFLMRRRNSHLDFDLELAKSQTLENPVYYVQYAHARICNIIRKSKRFDYKKAQLTLLREKEELQLLKTLSRFSNTLYIILKTLDPYNITTYLQTLATDFHRFYDRHRVLGENKDLTLSRLCLIEATRIVLAKGLKLLGVSAPEKM